MSRPKIQIAWTLSHKLLLIFATMLSIIAIYIPLSAYNSLPELVPSHYGFNGQADAFGSKMNVLVLPLICLITHIGLATLSRYPHIYNYPTSITETNAKKLYTQGRQFLLVVLLFTNTLFAYLSWNMIQTVHDSAPQINPFAIVFYGLAFFAYLIIALVRFSRA